MDIKENIKFILKQRGMTQKELADKLGLSIRTVQYYFDGNLTLTSLQKIADALDTTISTVISEEPLAMIPGPVPNKSSITATTLVCPHCGKEIKIIAKS